MIISRKKDNEEMPKQVKENIEKIEIQFNKNKMIRDKFYQSFESDKKNNYINQREHMKRILKERNDSEKL